LVKQTERIFICGASGQGKSYFLLWLVEERYVFKRNRRFVFIDYTGEYINLGKIPGVYIIYVTPQNFGKIDWQKTIEKYRKIVVESEGLHLNQFNREIIKIGYACMKTGNVQFIMDEAYNFIPIISPFTTRGQLAEQRRVMTYIASQGRKYGVGYCVATQRIAMVDKTPLTQANELFIFKMHAQQDLDSISPYIPNPDEIKKLPKFYCIHYTIDGKLEKIKAGKTSVKHLG